MKVAREFIFDPSLVLYLPLYELDGASFMSEDKHGHLCTVTGALWRPDGRYFDGIDDKITVPDAASLDISSTLTLVAWVNHDANGNEFMLSKWGATGCSYYILEDADKKLRMGVTFSDSNQEVICTTNLPTTTWYLAAGTYDQTYIRGYLNGVLNCTPKAQVGNIDVTAEDVYAGWGFSNTYAWAGKVGEAWIYNRALSASEIMRICQSTKWRYR